jgi:carbonic anhydrase
VQADYAPGSFITVDDETYMLAQFHYHAPSEHVVDGQSFAAELHLVHTNGNRLAVIGVLLQEGEGDETNPAYQPFIANLPAKKIDPTPTGDEIDAVALLPNLQTTYRYSGSLTTPPCTEGVTWLVMTEPVHLSAAQLADLKALFKEGNNRPPQPLNDRPVTEDTTP